MSVVQLSPDKIKFSTIDDAINALKEGRCVVIADDEGRENEGDLVCAASTITPDIVNFMVKEARGMICVALSKEQTEKLQLPQMVEDNGDPNQTAFTITADATSEFGVTTGISVQDRAKTIRRLANENAVASDFRRPGHISPVLAQKGGVLRRVGHTEAAMDIVRLADQGSAGVICEILNDDGTMARRDDLAAFAKKHNIPFITIAQLIEYRMERERFVTRRVEQTLETKYGTFQAIGYTDTLNGIEHLALIKGNLDKMGDSEPLVRVQHENILSTVLGETDDENAQQMAAAMTYINAEGNGVVVYLRGSTDTPQGLVGMLKNHGKQQNAPKKSKGRVDLRDYGIGAQILADLGIKRFKMITNNPKKIIGLRGYGLEVTETIQLPAGNYEFATRTKTEKSEQPVKNENAKTEVRQQAQPQPELKTETRVMTMKMGAQIMSGSFEG